MDPGIIKILSLMRMGYRPATEFVVGLGKFQTHQLDPKSSDYVNSGSDHDCYYFNTIADSTYVIETFDTQSDNATGLYLYDANGIELSTMTEAEITVLAM